MLLNLKKLLIIAGVCLVLATLALSVAARRYIPSVSARRAWKDKAIAEISTRVADSWPSNELAELKARGTNGPSVSDGWLSERLIVMRNGEWLAYANICQKEDRRIQDFFLGRASDGRWYYSTYHFCIGMIALKMEEQPDDLAAFGKVYYLRSFDGRSDECLQKTWPPDSR